MKRLKGYAITDVVITSFFFCSCTSQNFARQKFKMTRWLKYYHFAQTVDLISCVRIEIHWHCENSFKFQIHATCFSFFSLAETLIPFINRVWLIHKFKIYAHTLKENSHHVYNGNSFLPIFKIKRLQMINYTRKTKLLAYQINLTFNTFDWNINTLYDLFFFSIHACIEYWLAINSSFFFLSLFRFSISTIIYVFFSSS